MEICPHPPKALSHRTVTPSNTPASQRTIPTGSPAEHPCTRTAPAEQNPLAPVVHITDSHEQASRSRTNRTSEPGYQWTPAEDSRSAAADRRTQGHGQTPPEHQHTPASAAPRKEHRADAILAPLHLCIPVSILRPRIPSPCRTASYTTRPHTLRECRTIPHNTTEHNRKQHKTEQNHTKTQHTCQKKHPLNHRRANKEMGKRKTPHTKTRKHLDNP